MLKKRLISALIVVGMLIFGGLNFNTPVSASGSTSDSSNKGNKIFQDPCRHNPNSVICQNQNPVKMEDLVKKGLNILTWMAGILAVIMIIYAGFLFVQSAGDTNKVTTAKNIILYSVVGLIVVVVANAIVSFVIKMI
jgi:hypothetical protein